MGAMTGFAIAGLAMSSRELDLSNQTVFRLQNPEIGDALKINADAYTLEDIATIHLHEIKSRTLGNPDAECRFLGMSMGGMVLSILASKYREELPAKCKFMFLTTSANLQSNPAVPDSLLQTWRQVTPGDHESFRPVLEPFFSDTFRDHNPSAVEKYIRYRAMGENNQSPKAFMRQLNALRNFEGAQYFSNLRPEETFIVSGAEDYILGKPHHDELMNLVPGARGLLVPDLGHMVNFEMPHILEDFFKA